MVILKYWQSTDLSTNMENIGQWLDVRVVGQTGSRLCSDLSWSGFTVTSFYSLLPFNCSGSATAKYEQKWYFLALHQVSGFVCVCVCVCVFVVCVCVCVHVGSVSRRFRPVKGAKKLGMDILCTQCPIGSADYDYHFHTFILIPTNR